MLLAGYYSCYLFYFGNRRLPAITCRSGSFYMPLEGRRSGLATVVFSGSEVIQSIGACPSVEARTVCACAAKGKQPSGAKLQVGRMDSSVDLTRYNINNVSFNSSSRSYPFIRPAKFLCICPAGRDAANRWRVQFRDPELERHTEPAGTEDFASRFIRFCNRSKRSPSR